MAGMPSVPLDPQVAALLDLIARAKRPPIHVMDVEDAKVAYEKSAPILDISPPAVHAVENLHVCARDGHAIPVRLYSPREASWAEPLPLLVYFHGGGFTVGSVNSHDALCRMLASRADCMVLSVDYRLGPQWRFPTAANDAFDVLHWVFEEAPGSARIRRGLRWAGTVPAARWPRPAPCTHATPAWHPCFSC